MKTIEEITHFKAYMWLVDQGFCSASALRMISSIDPLNRGES